MIIMIMIIIIINNNIISSETEIAEKLNAFFSDIVKELNIKVKEGLLCVMSQILMIQLKEIFRNTKAILAYKWLRKTFDSNKHFHLTLFHLKKILKILIFKDTSRY